MMSSQPSTTDNPKAQLQTNSTAPIIAKRIIHIINKIIIIKRKEQRERKGERKRRSMAPDKKAQQESKPQNSKGVIDCSSGNSVILYGAFKLLFKLLVAHKCKMEPTIPSNDQTYEKGTLEGEEVGQPG